MGGGGGGRTRVEEKREFHDGGASGSATSGTLKASSRTIRIQKEEREREGDGRGGRAPNYKAFEPPAAKLPCETTRRRMIEEQGGDKEREEAK